MAKQPHKTVTVLFEEKAYIAAYSAGTHAVTVHSITGPEVNSGHERYGLGGTSIDSQESTAKLLTLQFLEERKHAQQIELRAFSQEVNRGGT